MMFHMSDCFLNSYPPFYSNQTNNMPKEADKQQKTYHKKATGNALITVKKHAKDHDLKLYGSCFWLVVSESFCLIKLT